MNVELIAEVATNHGGNIKLAKEFVWHFAEAGADWIKFQHTRVRHLRPDDPQYKWFQKAELSLEQFAELKAECEKAGTKFLTTVYNHQDVPEVASLGLKAIKIGSGEAAQADLAMAIRDASFIRTIVACGLTPPHRTAPFGGHVDYLHCVTRYPAPPTLAEIPYGHDSAYGEYARIGWSDHCCGLDGCRLAILHGARIIEKHVQLPTQCRARKPWEATLEEFKQLRAFADEDPRRFIGRWQFA